LTEVRKKRRCAVINATPNVNQITIGVAELARRAVRGGADDYSVDITMKRARYWSNCFTPKSRVVYVSARCNWLDCSGENIRRTAQ